MMLFEPTMRVERLLVRAGLTVAYEASFHAGVNIIRGANGSGKSTVMDLLFFGLGGDFTGWKPEALRCTDVIVEVALNATAVTLRREVSETHGRPMFVYWGSLGEAVDAPLLDWEVYPFRRTERKRSFSQVLFGAMRMPEMRGDQASNITLHQLLRLIYVDQLSPVVKLFRDEPYDSALTRKAVADLLLGVYDADLHDAQLQLVEAERDLAVLKRQYRSFTQLLAEAGGETSVEELEARIRERELARQDATEALLALKGERAGGQATGSSGAQGSVWESLRSLNDELDAIDTGIARVVLERSEARDFVSSLESRLVALEEASLARDELGPLAMSHCSACLKPLPERPEGACVLCGQPVEEVGSARSRMLRFESEIRLQLAESARLEQDRTADEQALRRRRPVVAMARNTMAARYRSLAGGFTSEYEARLQQLSTAVGVIDGEIAVLGERMKLVEMLRDVAEERDAAQERVSGLNDKLETARARVRERRSKVTHLLEKRAAALLRDDLPREEAFQDAQQVAVDWARDCAGVNGRARFSASSMVVLKNTVHAALMWLSCEEQSVRYPRLLLLDNVEDKGMEPERSHEFQRNLIRDSGAAGVDHQVIFTTSMLAPELEGTDLCVGPAYTETSKTLRV